jgi:hemerythrin superfamily protein
MQISSSNKNNEFQENVTFEQPIQLLLSCHEKIVHFSSALHQLTLTLNHQGWNKALLSSSEQIRRYFNIAVPEHHLDEENHLFPAIMAIDPECKQQKSLEIIQLLNELIKQHVESDTLWSTLDHLLDTQSTDFLTIEKLASRFKKEIHQHAHIENEHIFPYAQQHLSDSQLHLIGKNIAQRRGIENY